MSKKTVQILTLAAALCAAGSLWAHHSVTAVFDTHAKIVIKGELTEVEWINPHIQLHLKAKTDNTPVEEWKVEGGPPAWYRRVDVNKASFAKHVGQTVTIDGYPSKKAAEPYGYLLKITFADGASIESISAADATKGK